MKINDLLLINEAFLPLNKTDASLIGLEHVDSSILGLSEPEIVTNFVDDVAYKVCYEGWLVYRKIKEIDPNTIERVWLEDHDLEEDPIRAEGGEGTFSVVSLSSGEEEIDIKEIEATALKIIETEGEKPDSKTTGNSLHQEDRLEMTLSLEDLKGKEFILELMTKLASKGYIINTSFVKNFVFMVQRMPGGMTSVMDPVDWSEEVDESNIVFSGTNKPDIWDAIRKLIAIVRKRPTNILDKCGLCAQILTYHLIMNLEQINASGKDKIIQIQGGMCYDPHEWIRVKFSNDEDFKVLDMSSYVDKDGYYGDEGEFKAFDYRQFISPVTPVLGYIDADIETVLENDDTSIPYVFLEGLLMYDRLNSIKILTDL